MTDNNETYEELESLIDYDIYQYSSNPDMRCDEISLAGYIAANLTTRGYCKVNKEQIRKDTAKEILQEMFDVAKTAELYDTTNVAIYDIKVMAQKYGVEVDDE